MEGLTMDKQANEELLPCPFCGSKGIIGESEHSFYVACCYCHVEVYPYITLDSYGTTNKWTREEAVKRWDTRATPLVALESLHVQQIVADVQIQSIGKAIFHQVLPNSVNRWIADAICAKFGSPSARIPSQGEIIEILGEWKYGNKYADTTKAYEAIRKLCEELNGGSVK